VIHNGMLYDLVQRQGEGHKAFAVRNFSCLKFISFAMHCRRWQM